MPESAGNLVFFFNFFYCKYYQTCYEFKTNSLFEKTLAFRFQISFFFLLINWMSKFTFKKRFFSENAASATEIAKNTEKYEMYRSKTWYQ